MNKPLRSFLDSQNHNKDYDSSLIIQLYEDTDDETVLQILARFHETLVESIQKMEDALSNQENLDPIWKAAHKIAGTAELLGFRNFGSTARDLSHRFKESPTPNLMLDEVRGFLRTTILTKEVISSAFPNYQEYLF